MSRARVKHVILHTLRYAFHQSFSLFFDFEPHHGKWCFLIQGMTNNDIIADNRQETFRKVQGYSDLAPAPLSGKDRRFDNEGQLLSVSVKVKKNSFERKKPLKLCTIYAVDTFLSCNPNFAYRSKFNPRRVLTKPSKGVRNDGYDNEDGDYILYVSDTLGTEERHRYRVIDMLGAGTFGQVVKCCNLRTNEHVAVKIVKNKPAYYNQSLMEVAILELVSHP